MLLRLLLLLLMLRLPCQMVPFMKQKFKDIGIDYSMGGMTGSTVDSHRLITLAERFGADKQNELVEELFMNYFVEEKYLGDRAVLLAAAQKVGIDGAEAYLADESNGLAEVDKQLSLSKERQVSGVPFFIIDQKHTISGGVPPEEFLEVFEHLANQ
jgi:predicted DsbA family dithiol-disulfide isomerase